MIERLMPFGMLIDACQPMCCTYSRDNSRTLRTLIVRNACRPLSVFMACPAYFTDGLQQVMSNTHLHKYIY